ncbi:MAG TPA: hypothetical protein VE944_32895 [Nostoc sp.]|uniref:hypothetical protein n=1 Tax=Nostoc sp. TaxID=1180 RepID=UPI002D3D02BD|nr:hypothetical protein [Nostoc sp.]HYX19067.1 hypothetical protein [Nostoc sp.]
MAEPTLVEVFGTGATQDATTITIQKSSLLRLTPSATNTAESLLTGILLKAQAGLSQANFDANIDQSIYLTDGFPGFTTRGTNNTSYRVDQLTVNLAKIDTSSVIDPDDY